jgi:hypothetical protein
VQHTLPQFDVTIFFFFGKVDVTILKKTNKKERRE